MEADIPVLPAFSIIVMNDNSDNLMRRAFRNTQFPYVRLNAIIPLYRENLDIIGIPRQVFLNLVSRNQPIR